ncbi:MAG: hypothetical protein KGJ60_06630 [Verrucomicrobiota bacterium]|nr:hypothetical protein [Verrucomicrobiota bacterium]
MNSARSVSGQFIVTGPKRASLLAQQPQVATNADFVRLEPALLAVSAERIKAALWHELGVPANAPWRAPISLALHPAQSLDEDVTIVAQHFGRGWDYRVALPDVLARARFVRAMTGVLLLELANRSAGGRSAEIPAWLVDGLAQDLLAPGTQEVTLSSPDRTVNGLGERRSVRFERGVDPLAGARRVLSGRPALTFAPLSWPTDAQLAGADGGVYCASAQLFVSRLLALGDGSAGLRTMLGDLPRYYNWQTAFQRAFAADFATPLDVEKWWALQTLAFAAHNRGPTWRPEVSREQLDEILAVPADVRFASNALPARAVIPLQAVIRNFDFAQQARILQGRLRDLEAVQFRLAPPLAALAAEYRAVLDHYLARRSGARPRPTMWNKHPQPEPLKLLLRDTLKKLDALDARRRIVESQLQPPSSGS